MNNNISALERKAQNSYSLDPRIYELEKNAEEAYVKWKNEQEKINERREREKVLKDSFSRLQSEKEQLQKELRRYEKQNKEEETNGNYYQSKVFYLKSPQALNFSIHFLQVNMIILREAQNNIESRFFY